MITKTVMDYLKDSDGLSNIDEIIKKHRQESREEHNKIFSKERFVNVLIDDYKKHGNLIVAFDFDDTIHPSSPNYPCNLVINLLRVCTQLGFVMICFTARTLNSDMEMIREECKSLGIGCDYINTDADSIKEEYDFEHAHKIFYNIFLDDRAGLESAYNILWMFIEWFVDQDINSVDARKEGY